MKFVQAAAVSKASWNPRFILSCAKKLGGWLSGALDHFQQAKFAG